MSLYSEKVYEKSFKGYNSKETYLNVCKWLAKNVYSKQGMSEYITVNVEKKTGVVKGKDVCKFIVTIYASIDEKEISVEYCEKCKTLYTVLYCMDKPKCEECKKNVYKKELSKRLQLIKDEIVRAIESEWN